MRAEHVGSLTRRLVEFRTFTFRFQYVSVGHGKMSVAGPVAIKARAGKQTPRGNINPAGGDRS
jgi:hypothetical protein